MYNNILIDYRWSQKSGIGTMVDNMIPFLVKNFKKVYLLSNDREVFLHKNIEVIFIKSKIYSPLEQFEILLKKPKNCELFWFPNYNAPILLFKNKFIHIHDLSMLDSDINIFKRLYAYFLIMFNILTSTKILTVSEFSKKDILNRFKYIINNDKIDVIYNGVSESFFRIDKKMNKSILSVGIIKKRKNFTILIKAFLRLIKRKKFEGYKLFIIGQKKDMNNIDIEALKYESNSIVFTGKVSNSELFDYFKKASLFVFPTKFEGFGIPLIESMASSTPSICSDIPVLNEVGQDAPIYFNPNDVQDLENQMFKVLSDKNLSLSMVDKGLKVSKKYNWKKSTEKMVNIFRGETK